MRQQVEPIPLFALMDPGQDLDDEMLLLLLKALVDRRLVRCVGVVTTLEPAAARARLARGTLDELGLQHVPVGAGSAGTSTSASLTLLQKAMSVASKLEYVREARPVTDGMVLMVRALGGAADRSVTLLIVASLADAAALLRAHEQLFVTKVRQVVIQGGVKAFEPGIAPTGVRLEPDSAHNNEFDAASAAFFYARCQELGVPLLVVSRFAAASCQMSRAIYDELAATGSRIGAHLQETQAASIERLWRQANAPDGSTARGGLPSRCNKRWFCQTFCAGDGLERRGDEPIWDLVRAFNMYDPLALLAAQPCLEHFFAFAPLEVDGIVHRVVGMSADECGVRDGSGLSNYLFEAFLEGVAT